MVLEREAWVCMEMVAENCKEIVLAQQKVEAWCCMEMVGVHVCCCREMGEHCVALGYLDIHQMVQMLELWRKKTHSYICNGTHTGS